MIVTSTDNQYIKEIKKLLQRKYRDEVNSFLVEGEHLIEEAYACGLLREVILEKDECIALEVKKTFVTSNIMKELSSLATPCKMIGVCEKKGMSDTIGKHIIVLDNIQDPGNLGAVIRSAVAFNIDTIILGEGCVDLYNPKVLRATQGLIFKINIIEADLKEILPRLKKDTYTILGTRMTGGSNIKEYNTPDKYALVMGNEGKGIDPAITPLCDDFIFIKMNSLCESLNVAIACSIILYQLER